MELDHAKCVPKSASAAERLATSVQVSHSAQGCWRTGLIIRRSWIRAPPAPLADLAGTFLLPADLLRVSRQPTVGSGEDTTLPPAYRLSATRSHSQARERRSCYRREALVDLGFAAALAGLADLARGGLLTGVSQAAYGDGLKGALSPGSRRDGTVPASPRRRRYRPPPGLGRHRAGNRHRRERRAPDRAGTP